MHAHRLQPATVILLWLSLLGGALVLPASALLLVAGFSLLMAFILAYDQLRRILFRSRWLMVSLIVLFVWLTPGTTIPYTWGATIEGAQLASNQLSRLLLSIAAVAILLRTLDNAQLIAGLRDLATPLGVIQIDRDRLAVRLALTLDRIDGGVVDSRGVLAALRDGTSNDAPMNHAIERIKLAETRLGRPDAAAMGFAALIIFAGWALV